MNPHHGSPKGLCSPSHTTPASKLLQSQILASLSPQILCLILKLGPTVTIQAAKVVRSFLRSPLGLFLRILWAPSLRRPGSLFCWGRVHALILPHDRVSTLQGNVFVRIFNPLCCPQLPPIWPQDAEQVSGTQGYTKGAERPLLFACDGCFLELRLSTMS